MASSYDVRCSVIVLHKGAVLLLHRTRGGLDDWVLPGGTPREGESMTACARRELFEETGISADPSRVAFVVESAPPGSSRRLLDIVFAVSEPVLGWESSREPGLEPHYVPPGQLVSLNLHPSLAGHLNRLLDPGAHGYAPISAITGGSRRYRAQIRQPDGRPCSWPVSGRTPPDSAGVRLHDPSAHRGLEQRRSR